MKYKPISQREYDRHMQRASDNRRYFKSRFDYFKVMPFMEASFFQYLLAVSGYKNTKKLKSGWFLCSVEYLAGDKTLIRWDRHIQTRLFSKLQSLGFLDVKKKGLPPTRWVKLYQRKVEQAVDELVFQSTANRVDCSTANRVGNKNKGIIATSVAIIPNECDPSASRNGYASPNGDFHLLNHKPRKGKSSISPTDVARSDRLYKALGRSGLAKRTGALEFKRLRKNISDKRIDDTLDKFLQFTKVNGFHYPKVKPGPPTEVFSAKTFRQRFIWIESHFFPQANQNGEKQYSLQEICAPASEIIKSLPEAVFANEYELPTAVHKTYKFMRRFLNKVNQLADDKTNSLNRFAMRIRARWGTDPKEYTQGYFTEQIQNLIAWSEWKGYLKKYILSMKNEDLRKQLRKLAIEYTCEPKSGNVLFSQFAEYCEGATNASRA